MLIPTLIPVWYRAVGVTALFTPSRLEDEVLGSLSLRLRVSMRERRDPIFYELDSKEGTREGGHGQLQLGYKFIQ